MSVCHPLFDVPLLCSFLGGLDICLNTFTEFHVDKLFDPFFFFIIGKDEPASPCNHELQLTVIHLFANKTPGSELDKLYSLSLV